MSRLFCSQSTQIATRSFVSAWVSQSNIFFEELWPVETGEEFSGELSECALSSLSTVKPHSTQAEENLEDLEAELTSGGG